MIRRVLGMALALACATAAGATDPPSAALPLPAQAAPGTPVADPPAPSAVPLRVGIVEAPPFAYRDSDGAWTGLAVVLWRVIAGHLEQKWDWVELDTAEAFPQLAAGTLDLLVGDIAITAERARHVDFSVPFLSGELGVAVPRGSALGVFAAARRILTRHLLTILFGLALSIVLAGTLVWAFERRANPSHFGGKVYEGIGAGIWWAAVTMTTVGYGDTLPRTRGGRVIALVWMFVSIVVISLFTASVVSMVTLANLHSRVESVEDLRRLRVAAVAGGVAEDFLRHHGITSRPFPTPDDALEALAGGEADVVVGHVPVMRWIVRERWADRILVAAPFLEQEFYAFALTPGRDLQKALNEALLKVIETDDWRAVRVRYLGH